MRRAVVVLVLAAIAHWPTARTTQLTYSRCDPQNISFRQPTGRPPDAEIAQKAHRAFQGPSLFVAAHESVAGTKRTCGNSLTISASDLSSVSPRYFTSI
jgi:hypothetical protein